MIALAEADLIIQKEQLSYLQMLVGEGVDMIAPIPQPPITAESSNVNQVSFGGISVTGGMSDSDISYITNQISRELKKAKQRGF